jgi:membrane-bound ClpP family serine protease
MDWFIILALLVVGWVLLFLEIFFIPGVTVLVAIGALMMVAGIYFSFAHYGTSVGLITLSVTTVLVSLSLWFAFRSGFWKKLSLRDTNEGKMNLIDSSIKVGDMALSISRIAPSGKAMIGDTLYEVHSSHGFIDENSDLIIEKISMNKIYVKKNH